MALELGLQSLMVAPITRGPQILGLLAVADRVGRAPFSDEDLNLLLALAGQATIAVENLRLHEEIKKANALLQEYDRLKSEFVGIVAHDFRRPLMAIRGFAELVADEPDLPPETRLEFMRTVINETDHLAVLANDTLLITQIETGQMSYNFREIDVGPFLLDAVPLGLSEHSVLMDVPPNFPKIWADPDRMRQVLSNLVSNAAKYSAPGTSVMVRVRERGAQHIVIEVIDHGLGIPPEQVGKLFQKFARVRTEDHLKVSGTGLGLYISRLIVEGHGGQIWVESELGKGSTFGLAMPLDPRTAQKPAPAADKADAGRRRASPSARRRPETALRSAPSQLALHLGEARLDRDGGIAPPARARVELDHDARVLEQVPGEHRHDGLARPDHPLPHQPAHPRHRRRRGGLAADAGRVDHRLRVEDLAVGGGGHDAARRADRAHGAVVAGGVPDPDRGGDRLGLHPVAPREGRPEAAVEGARALRLHGGEARHAADQPERCGLPRAPCRTRPCCRGCRRAPRSSPAAPSRAAAAAPRRSSSAPRCARG